MSTYEDTDVTQNLQDGGAMKIQKGDVSYATSLIRSLQSDVL